MAPSLLKVLTGIIVDAKLIEKRKDYFFYSGIVQAYVFYLASFAHLFLEITPFTMTMFLFIG